tara:strand:+ start:352 stop:567 length:216 start_codon:yes stop_codon:yes gene_type:complete
MVFNYESINDALFNHHPNLSGEWTSLDWNDSIATVIYMLEDGSEVLTTVNREGKVTAPDQLIEEMNNINNT